MLTESKIRNYYCYMKRNSRLSAVLHALMHMAEREAPMTSDDLALCLDTNAVVVRRTMAGLRVAGIVQSGRGHGGGWHFARPLAEISLLDIYNALGEPIDGLGPLVQGGVRRSISNSAPPSMTRKRVETGFSTGVRAVDIFAPLCLGQRLGIFAGSGVGKSTLL